MKNIEITNELLGEMENVYGKAEDTDSIEDQRIIALLDAYRKNQAKTQGLQDAIQHYESFILPEEMQYSTLIARIEKAEHERYEALTELDIMERAHSYMVDSYNECKRERDKAQATLAAASSIVITNEIGNAINAIDHFQKGGVVPIGGSQFPNDECCWTIVRELKRLLAILTTPRNEDAK